MMVAPEVSNEHLIRVVSQVLNPPEPKKRNPERRRNWQEFLRLSQELFEEHGLSELPQWPLLEKLTRPVDLTIGNGKVPIQVAYFAYRYHTGFAYYDKTALITTVEGQDQPNHLFAVAQRYQQNSPDEPVRAYITNSSNHLGGIASDDEVARFAVHTLDSGSVETIAICD